MRNNMNVLNREKCFNAYIAMIIYYANSCYGNYLLLFYGEVLHTKGQYKIPTGQDLI